MSLESLGSLCTPPGVLHGLYPLSPVSSNEEDSDWFTQPRLYVTLLYWAVPDIDSSGPVKEDLLVGLPGFLKKGR